MDIDDLKENFIYKNGYLYRLVTHINKSGYSQFKYKNQSWLGHRLIFAIHHGYLPEVVDHIDGNPSNNLIENLRGATRMENTRNSKTKSNSMSNVKNVKWLEKNKKWRVRVSENYRRHHIGVFEDLELAQLVAEMAMEKYHGNFVRHKVKE